MNRGYESGNRLFPTKDLNSFLHSGFALLLPWHLVAVASVLRSKRNAWVRPERHQEYPRSTKTACVSLRQRPRTDSCFHRVGQTAGSKLQVSSSAAAPHATAPCKSQRLTSSCTPRQSTTDATDNSSTRTFAGLLYNSIQWHFALKIASRERGG